MLKRRTKVFVVCEDHEYKDVSKVIGLFPSREEAERCIRSNGQVQCWKAEYFMPFALVWAQVRTNHKDYGPLDVWFWIEEHELEQPLIQPKFRREISAMVVAVFCLLTGISLPGHTTLNTLLVLFGCIAAVIALGSALRKS